MCATGAACAVTTKRSRPWPPRTPPRPHDSDPHDARRAADEHSGHTDRGGTPPAEGSGVGPTNPQMDVEQPGERSTGRIVLFAIIALLVIGILLFVLGRVFDLFG